MSEQVWLSATDPQLMIRYLLGTDYPRVQDVQSFPNCKTSSRKLRLFACACYHHIRHLLPDDLAQAAVIVGERFADGFATLDEFEEAGTSIRVPCDALENRWRASRGSERVDLLPTHQAYALALIVLWTEAQKAAYYASSNASYTFADISNPGAASSSNEYSSSRMAEEQFQSFLLRDIFGNPFRPVTFNPPRLTSTVLALAQGIYDEKVFDRLPILADALQDAGCDNEDILNHLRLPGEHCRGCWALDLVLGRS